MATNPALGHFVWYELMTQDPARARTYYAELFGLEIQDCEMGPTVYPMLSVEGEPIGGIVDLSAMEGMANIPSHWMSYIEVPDPAQAATRCKELGGQVLKEPTEIPGAGTFTVLQDPTGGFFAAWTSTEPKPPRTWEQIKPGMLCWSELLTSDVDKARSFYKAMLGWEEDAMPMGEGPTYYIQKVGETGIGGIMQVPMEGIPTHWCNYFLVPNVDEWHQRALDLGGTERKEPSEVPEVGRFSVVSDPSGASFALWESSTTGSESGSESGSELT